jgi:hypothetical protein
MSKPLILTSLVNDGKSLRNGLFDQFDFRDGLFLCHALKLQIISIIEVKLKNVHPKGLS